MRRAALGLLLAALAAPAARAHTVEQMMRMCASVEAPGPATNDGVFCLGVADGIAQVLALGCLIAESGGDAPPAFRGAMPPSPAAAVLAFLDRASEAPDRCGEHHRFLFVEALREAFPCES